MKLKINYRNNFSHRQDFDNVWWINRCFIVLDFKFQMETIYMPPHEVNAGLLFLFIGYLIYDLIIVLIWQHWNYLFVINSDEDVWRTLCMNSRLRLDVFCLVCWSDTEFVCRWTWKAFWWLANWASSWLDKMSWTLLARLDYQLLMNLKINFENEFDPKEMCSDEF